MAIPLESQAIGPVCEGRTERYFARSLALGKIENVHIPFIHIFDPMHQVHEADGLIKRDFGHPSAFLINSTFVGFVAVPLDNGEVQSELAKNFPYLNIPRTQSGLYLAMRRLAPYTAITDTADPARRLLDESQFFLDVSQKLLESARR